MNDLSTHQLESLTIENTRQPRYTIIEFYNTFFIHFITLSHTAPWDNESLWSGGGEGRAGAKRPSSPITPPPQFWRGFTNILLTHHLDKKNPWLKAPACTAHGQTYCGPRLYFKKWVHGFPPPLYQIGLRLRPNYSISVFKVQFLYIATLGSILDSQLSWESSKFQLARWSHGVVIFPIRNPPIHPPPKFGMLWSQY